MRINAFPALVLTAAALGIAACATTRTAARPFEPNDWVYNPDTGHYYRLTGKMPWPLAREVAESYGGYLATVNDADENAWIMDTFQPTEAVWVGLNDFHAEGRWEWVNGEEAAYSNWRRGQPNNSGGIQHAVSLDSWNMPDPGRWNDNPPMQTRQGVIELERPARFQK